MFQNHYTSRPAQFSYLTMRQSNLMDCLKLTKYSKNKTYCYVRYSALFCSQIGKLNTILLFKHAVSCAKRETQPFLWFVRLI